jgi:hypothetical protein
MSTWQPGDRWDAGNPENRERTRCLKSELRTLLLDWDQIGVGEAAEARDEYDGYLSPLLHTLHDGDSVEAVSAYLVDMVEGMGINPRPEVERRIAETLVAWWTNATSE